MKKTIIYLVSAALAIAACSKDNSINSVTGLKGNWYEVGASRLIDHYVSFDKGMFKTFASQDGKHYTCRDSVYTINDTVSPKSFNPVNSEEYHISGGRLICGNHNYGPVSVHNDTLDLNGRKYVRLNGFAAKGYSRIEMERATIPDLGPELEVASTHFSVLRPDLEEFKSYAYARSEQPWIYGIETKSIGIQGPEEETYILTFHIMANPDKKTREGKIKVFYPPALPQEVTVIQSGTEVKEVPGVGLEPTRL